jgi:FdrA protein
VPATVALVRKHAYVDSVSLLQVTAEVLAAAHVEDAAVVMATELNREVLRDSNLLVGDALSAGINDLVIAVRGTDESAARAAIEQAEALLTRRRTASTSETAAAPRSLRSAHRAAPHANLAVISVPGPYAAAEARQALADGLNVFLFSDNVDVQDEVDLKRTAAERGLLVMGPDCGTAILNGFGLGFANVVRRGSVGIVGASGTGIQEVASLVHQAGHGISHAIGTGSRDLHAAIGGVTTLQAIGLLRHDTATETIVLISKPSDAAVASRVLQALAATHKPAVACLQGFEANPPSGVQVAGTLEEAASLATGVAPKHEERPGAKAHGLQVRGLFCGGTLAHEVRMILGETVAHEVIDFGDDQYTRGRAHPMIDPTLRNDAIRQAAREPGVGVILLDFILGLAAHADPVGAALPAITAACVDGRDVSVLAHVVGTDEDPQGLATQVSRLRSAGVEVFASNAAAARAARPLA